MYWVGWRRIDGIAETNCDEEDERDHPGVLEGVVLHSAEHGAGLAALGEGTGFAIAFAFGLSMRVSRCASKVHRNPSLGSSRCSSGLARTTHPQQGRAHGLRQHRAQRRRSSISSSDVSS